jgi:hypothetical protein
MSGINIPVTVTGADTAATQLGKVSTSLGGVAKSSNTAGQSLINLGRIAQDAPFGFIAIQNNINPLIESFGRLKAETGSTGSAFITLFKSLGTTAGLGLAVSLATAAFTKLSKDGFFKTAEASDEAAKKIAEFNKSLKDAETAALATGVKLSGFAQIAADSTLPLTQRNEALKQANKILGDYGEKLTLANVATQKGTDIVNQYTAALVAQALANKLAENQANLLIQQRDAQRQVTAAQLESTRAQGAFVKNAASLTIRDQELGRGTAFTIARDKAVKSLTAAQTQLATINKQISDNQTFFNEQLLKSTLLFGKLGTKANEGSDAVKKSVKKIKKAVEDEKIGRLELPATIRVLTREDAAAQIEEANRIARETQESFDKIFRKATPINIPLNVRVSDKEKELKEYYTNLANIANEQSAILANAVIDSFVALGEGLGKVLTGKGSFGEVFAGIAQILGEALKSLGKSVIVGSKLIATIKTALNAAFAGNPILGVVAGVALIALGSAIQNSLPKFADGVTNFGGGVALVGERGPELVRLPSGSDVIPNYRLNSLSASSPMGYIPNVTLRGSDLVIAFNRQTATNRRNG